MQLMRFDTSFLPLDNFFFCLENVKRVGKTKTPVRDPEPRITHFLGAEYPTSEVNTPHSEPFWTVKNRGFSRSDGRDSVASGRDGSMEDDQAHRCVDSDPMDSALGSSHAW